MTTAIAAITTIDRGLEKTLRREAAAESAEQQAKIFETTADANDRTQYDEIVREGLDREAEAKKRSLVSRGVIYFSAEDNQLQSEQKQILQAVAEQIGQGSETIEIRGQAAERTERAASDSAYVRCVETRDYLVKLGIEPGRLRIAVGGEIRRRAKDLACGCIALRKSRKNREKRRSNAECRCVAFGIIRIILLCGAQA